PGFPSLRNDDIDAAIDGSPGIIGSADRVHDDSATGFGALYERSGIAPEKRNDRYAFFEADFKTILLRKFHVQIHRKGLRGERTHFSQRLAKGFAVGAPQRQSSQRTRIADGGCKMRRDRAAHRGLNYGNFDSKHRTQLRHQLLPTTCKIATVVRSQS